MQLYHVNPFTFSSNISVQRYVYLTHGYVTLEKFRLCMRETRKKLAGDAPLRPPFKEDICVSGFDKVWLAG